VGKVVLGCGQDMRSSSSWIGEVGLDGDADDVVFGGEFFAEGVGGFGGRVGGVDEEERTAFGG
jgi:hypothetical protein